jgi:hypothetical protein
LARIKVKSEESLARRCTSGDSGNNRGLIVQNMRLKDLSIAGPLRRQVVGELTHRSRVSAPSCCGIPQAGPPNLRALGAQVVPLGSPGRGAPHCAAQLARRHRRSKIEGQQTAAHAGVLGRPLPRQSESRRGPPIGFLSGRMEAASPLGFRCPYGPPDYLRFYNCKRPRITVAREQCRPDPFESSFGIRPARTSSYAAAARRAG